MKQMNDSTESSMNYFVQCGGRKKKKIIEKSKYLDKSVNALCAGEADKIISNISKENELNMNHNILSSNEKTVLASTPCAEKTAKTISNILNENKSLNYNFKRLSLNEVAKLVNKDHIKKTLYGSFSQGSIEHMLPETVGTQCTTMSIMSIIYSYVKVPSLWTEDDLNEILLNGDKQHLSIIEKRIEHLNKSSNKLHLITDPLQYLNVDNFLEISKKIEFNENYFEVLSEGDYISDQYFKTRDNFDGHLNEDELKFVFGMTFPKFSNCVITIENISMAIMYEICDEEVHFHLFDSHADSVTGTSTLNTFKNIDDLKTFLLKKFNSTNRFEVNPLIIEKLDDNMKDLRQSETVIEINEDDEFERMADDEVLLLAHNSVEPESKKEKGQQ